MQLSVWLEKRLRLSHDSLHLVDPTNSGCTRSFRWLPLGAVSYACGIGRGNEKAQLDRKAFSMQWF